MTNVANLGSFGDVSGSSLMFRNKIINGAMKIDQRNAGATQTFTAAAALAYSVDRFYGYCTGANVTGARVAGSGSTQYRYQFTGAASVTAIGFGRRIEAANCYDLAGQPAVFSVDLSNSLLTTVTWTAYYANTSDTFGTLASPTRTQIATGTFAVSSTLTRYSASMNVPAAATTGIEIVLTVGAQTSGTWVIGNVQLEQGTAPTPFEQRPIGLELSLCQRYYEKSYSQSLAVATAGSFGISSNIYQYTGTSTTNFYPPSALFKTVKRTSSPTCTVYAPGSGSSGNATLSGTGNITAAIGSSTDHSLSITISAARSAGDLIGWLWTAESEL